MPLQNMNMLLAALAGLLSWLSWLSWPQTRFPPCRCRPWEACWPAEAEWSAFNHSIGGNLVRLRPAGYVCHDPTFDLRACDELQALALDSGWKASNPATLQHWIWESGTTSNRTCPARPSTEMLCDQGRVPRYSATVKSVMHIQSAVTFANRYKLRLVIKNTGHDGSGRSAAPDSLQIHTHGLNDIQYHANFVPSGSTVNLGPAVTIGAGVMHGDLYARGAQEGFIVVGGECPTVGAAGGFLTGGGVSSFLSYVRGLAVDNVLEFQIVTADGRLVTANHRQNPALFWALRGGGGGTYGVVTQATVRAYPDDPVVVTTVSIAAPRENEEFWREGVVGLLAALRAVNRENVPGQFLLNPVSSTSMEAMLTLYFLNATVQSDGERRIAEHLAFLEGSGLRYNLSSIFQAKVSSTLRMVPDIDPRDYGILQGSVLVSKNLFDSPDGPPRLADTFARVPMRVGDLLFTSNLGGQVNAEQEIAGTSMHPGWRSAAQLINFVRTVEPSIDGKMSALDELTNAQMSALYSLDPDLKVSYLNLGDPNEGDFQRVYWGENYGRLYQIKQEVDKDGLFITRLGVGSEDWDDDGMCRKTHTSLSRVWKVWRSSI
ncbi:hypothetical protein BBP40_004847 [Aspergillus hancockii]|nr:hypothetical protein BBP40_004847 [Aspergillus hancockii]